MLKLVLLRLAVTATCIKRTQGVGSKVALFGWCPMICRFVSKNIFVRLTCCALEHDCIGFAQKSRFTCT